MTKQEQIEEMANYYREYRKKQTGEKFYEFIDDKVPDNVVVLTGRAAGRTGDIWRQAQEKTRKETAKEILSDLLDLHNSVQDINQKTDFYCSIEQLIAEIEIKYDIEVEE